jgi:hypothetical protein
MQLYETFEVKFKDKNSAEQKSLLKNAIIDLYQNFDDYKIVERSKGKKDQTSDFMDKFHITKFDIFNLLNESLSVLNLAKYADILVDRDREDNLLYILYFPNAKVGNWDYSKSREKLLYIKWNPLNKNIISFHTMRDIQDTNRDSLMENKMKITEEKFEIYNTHVKYRFINRWCNLYYDKVSENLFVLYDGYIETVDQIKPTEFECIYDGYTLCKPTDKIIQIWKRDRKLEEKSSMNIQDVIDFIYTHTDEDFVLTDLEVLEDLKKDLKDGTKPMYELVDVKGVKDDIIQTIELNSEQKKVLNDFVKKVEGLYKGKGKIEEKLSLQQIRSRDVYSKNAHVNKFYNIRKDLVGTPNRNIKFITSQLNDDGSADFLFQTVVTPYEDVDHVYKELIDAPIADIVNASAMKTNNSGEYMMCLRINDFWDLIEELEVVEKNEFDKNTLSAILDLSEDVKYSCNCISFVWSGISYFATQEDASLIPNNIYPKKWDKYRAGALVCKHLSGLCRNLGFFENLMAMSIKKNMREQGLID